MMHRELFSIPVHVVVITSGRCSKCQSYNEQTIFDYGEMSYGELEKKLEQTVHPVEPISCFSCGIEYFPTNMVFRDLISQQTICIEEIDYTLVDPENLREEQEGQNRRFEIFREKEEAFWKAYEDYALNHWADILQELNKEEYQYAFDVLKLPQERTTAQYRRTSLCHFCSHEEKRRFWRVANHYFIYDHMLDLGPMAWKPEEDAKKFGLLRVRFVLLYFPMDERLERLRTEHIGRIVRKDRSENAFLFQRIAQLADNLALTRKKATSYFHQLEQARHEIARLQQALSEAYEETRKVREQKPVSSRNPDDVRKIRNLKGLVNELIAEIRDLETRLPIETEIAEEQSGIADVSDKPDERGDLSVLAGKTIGILGGIRRERSRDESWPCVVLTHPGDRWNPEFYQVLAQSDIIVVITTHISHASMWQAKAYAMDKEKTIVFTSHANIGKILEQIAKRGVLRSFV